MRRSRVMVTAVIGTLALIGALIGALIAGAPIANAEQPPGPVTGTLTPGRTQHLGFTGSRQHIVLKVFLAGNDERLFLGTADDHVALQYTAYAPMYNDYRILARNPAYRSAITLPYQGWNYVEFYPAQQATGSVDVTSYLSPPRAGGKIEPGQTVRAATTQRGQQELFTFFGREGQRPTVFATSQTFTNRDAPDQGAADAVTVLFLGPADEQQPVDPDVGIGLIDGHRYAYTEGRALDLTGTWTMLVQGRGPDSIGSMSFGLALVDDQATTQMAAGTATTVRTAQPGVNAARSIRLTAGQQLSLTLSGASLSAQASPVGGITPQGAVTIFGPDGSSSASTTIGNGAGPITVTYPATRTGTYTAVFDPVANTIGSLTAVPGVTDQAGATR